MKTFTTIACFVAFSIVLGALGNANAATITYDDSFTDVITELVDETLTVDLFDGSLGTLTKATLTFDTTVETSGDVTNTAQNNQGFTVSTLVESFVTSPVAGSPAPLLNLDPFAPFSLVHSDNYVDVVPNVPQAFGPGSEMGTGTFMITNAADLLALTGIGTFSYESNTTIGISTSGGGGNVDTNIMTMASGTLEVEYTYTEIDEPPSMIPEPSTSVLMLIAATVGLGFTTRRRRNR